MSDYILINNNALNDVINYHIGYNYESVKSNDIISLEYILKKHFGTLQLVQDMWCNRDILLSLPEVSYNNYRLRSGALMQTTVHETWYISTIIMFTNRVQWHIILIN